MNMPAQRHSDVQQIRDGAETFNVTVIEANQSSKRLVLFAVGRGGNPERHLSLLRSVAALGCTVIAPHFDMLTSLVPSKVELDKRVRRVEASGVEYCKAELPIIGIGHSIGAVTLLALAGGEAQTLAWGHGDVGVKIEIRPTCAIRTPNRFFPATWRA